VKTRILFKAEWKGDESMVKVFDLLRKVFEALIGIWFLLLTGLFCAYMIFSATSLALNNIDKSFNQNKNIVSQFIRTVPTLSNQASMEQSISESINRILQKNNSGLASEGSILLISDIEKAIAIISREVHSIESGSSKYAPKWTHCSSPSIRWSADLLEIAPDLKTSIALLHSGSVTYKDATKLTPESCNLALGNLSSGVWNNTSIRPKTPLHSLAARLHSSCLASLRFNNSSICGMNNAKGGDVVSLHAVGEDGSLIIPFQKDNQIFNIDLPKNMSPLRACHVQLALLGKKYSGECRTWKPSGLKTNAIISHPYFDAAGCGIVVSVAVEGKLSGFKFVLVADVIIRKQMLIQALPGALYQNRAGKNDSVEINLNEMPKSHFVKSKMDRKSMISVSKDTYYWSLPYLDSFIYVKHANDNADTSREFLLIIIVFAVIVVGIWLVLASAGISLRNRSESLKAFGSAQFRIHRNGQFIDPSGKFLSVFGINNPKVGCILQNIVNSEYEGALDDKIRLAFDSEQPTAYESMVFRLKCGEDDNRHAILRIKRAITGKELSLEAICIMISNESVLLQEHSSLTTFHIFNSGRRHISWLKATNIDSTLVFTKKHLDPLRDTQIRFEDLQLGVGDATIVAATKTNMRTIIQLEIEYLQHIYDNLTHLDKHGCSLGTRLRLSHSKKEKISILINKLREIRKYKASKMDIYVSIPVVRFVLREMCINIIRRMGRHSEKHDMLRIKLIDGDTRDKEVYHRNIVLSLTNTITQAQQRRRKHIISKVASVSRDRQERRGLYGIFCIEFARTIDPRIKASSSVMRHPEGAFQMFHSKLFIQKERIDT